MRVSFGSGLFALVAVTLLPETTNGHPISLTSAVVEIEEGVIRVDLRVMAEDIVTIQEVEPDAEDLFSTSVLSAEAETYVEVVLQEFSIQDDRGRKLSGNVVEIDRSALPTEALPRQSLMSFSIVYKIEYTLDGRPPTLTFSQSFSSRPGVLLSITDVIVLQNDRLVGQPAEITSDLPYRVTLEWPPQKVWWFARLEFWLCVFSVVLLLGSAVSVLRAREIPAPS